MTVLCGCCVIKANVSEGSGGVVLLCVWDSCFVTCMRVWLCGVVPVLCLCVCVDWCINPAVCRRCTPYHPTAVNNEFYVTPVFDVALKRGDDVRVVFCDKMWGTGTPADYEKFLYGYQGDI